MRPFFEGGEGGAKIFGERGGESGGGVGDGMGEGQLVGVKRKAGEQGAFFLEFAEFVAPFEFGKQQGFSAVEEVDGEGVADGFKVDTDLMPAAGDGENLEQRHSPPHRLCLPHYR